jgi:hypothetical protein
MNLYKHIALSLAVLVFNKTSTSQVTSYTNSNACDSCQYFVCGDTVQNIEKYELNLCKQLYTINILETNLVDSLIKAAILNYNSNLSWIRSTGDTITNDSLELAASSVFTLNSFITTDNQRMILIKYMCDALNDEIYKANFCDWQIFGGGNCYFSLWINLTTRKFKRLSVNAPI